MSIGSVNNSSNLAAVSAVSGVDQTQPATDTAKAKQLLHISMLESEMQPVLLKLERFAGEVNKQGMSLSESTSSSLRTEISVLSGLTARLQDAMGLFEQPDGDALMGTSRSSYGTSGSKFA